MLAPSAREHQTRPNASNESDNPCPPMSIVLSGLRVLRSKRQGLEKSLPPWLPRGWSRGMSGSGAMLPMMDAAVLLGGH